jgi:hypothetical protein
MLQLFLQIPDRSTATRRGRSHFKKMSLHDAETPLFSTVHFHDAETPLFSTDDLHATETPLVDPLDLLLRPNNHHFPFFTFLCCRNTTVRNPFFFSITETPNSHYLFHFLTNETTPSSNCFSFSLSMLQHHCSTLFLPITRTLQSTITSDPIIAETTPSNNCFACSFSVAETPLSATLHHFFSRC